MCHQLLPSNFRSYGATPIKGDSESFRPYYRLVNILATLMSSVIILLHPVTSVWSAEEFSLWIPAKTLPTQVIRKWLEAYALKDTG